MYNGSTLDSKSRNVGSIPAAPAIARSGQWAAVWMRGATAAAVAQAAFSTVGVKSFSRVERVERVDLAVSSLRRGATQPPVNGTVDGPPEAPSSQTPKLPAAKAIQCRGG